FDACIAGYHLFMSCAHLHAGLSFSAESSLFLAARAPNPPWAAVGIYGFSSDRDFLMSGEVSYFSRFFVKFVEIIAAGLASAISAYLLAHFAGLLSSPTPPSHPALTTGQVGPAASGVTAQPTPPVAAATANEHPAPQDSPEAKLVPKTGRDLPPRKHTKTDTSVAGKEPRNQKSAEEQVRAALANVDAHRRGPGASSERAG